MTDELVNVTISAIMGAIAGGIVNLLLEMRKERKEDKKEKQKEKRKIYEKRPELKIVEYKEYLSHPGHKLKKECDVNIFLTKIESVSIEDDVVTPHYKKELFNEDEWCCVIYSFKNEGKTDIQCISPICTYKKDTILCNVSVAQEILQYELLSYSTTYDKKLRVGESFTMRVCYHKDCIVAGMISAIMAMGIEDCNGQFWMQPLFAPNDKIYDASRITYKEYRDDILPDRAIECFKKPWLW